MHIISEEKQISGVRRVILREFGQLFITQGPVETLTIEGPDALTSLVRTEVRNDELLIDLDGGWWDRTWRAFTSSVEGKSLKFHLTVKELEGLFVTGASRVKAEGLQLDNFQLIMKGAGDIKLTNLQANRLDIDMPGAGLLLLSGNAVEQNVVMRGAGSYDAPRLQTERTNVKLQGVGKASVWATKELNAEVDGVGKIEYYGSPDVTQKVSGLGKISQVG